MLEGALYGAIGGVIGIIIVLIMKKQKTTSLMRSVKDQGVEYSGFFYYASPTRFQRSFKIYDSTGLLYLIGNTVYYKTSTMGSPIAFNLLECKVQLEPDWRRLKWFSITNAAGQKYYFDSYKMGALSNNSDETMRAFNLFKSKTSGHTEGRAVPPPLNG